MSYRPLIMTMHHHLAQRKTQESELQKVPSRAELDILHPKPKHDTKGQYPEIQRVSIPRAERTKDQIKKQRYAPM